MIPRRDPETAPVAVGVQLIKRGQIDEYGAERCTGHAQTRPRPHLLVTRNGLPEPGYRYRGTGQSMTQAEAEGWLAAR